MHAAMYSDGDVVMTGTKGPVRAVGQRWSAKWKYPKVIQDRSTSASGPRMPLATRARTHPSARAAGCPSGPHHAGVERLRWVRLG